MNSRGRATTQRRDSQGAKGAVSKRRVSKKGDFASVRDILERSPAMKLIRERDAMAELQSLWRDAVGATVSESSQITKYRGGRLFVEVASSPLRLELSSFRKKELVTKLRTSERFRALADIVFRSG